MRTIGLRDAFARDGYVIVPGALSRSRVIALRERLDAIFRDRPTETELRPDVIVQDKELCELLFLDPVVRSLADVLGPGFTYLPEFTIPRNRFGTPGTMHRDSDSEGRAPYLLRRDYRFAKCGIYLQDNDHEWGGGITVVPGSHRFPLRTPSGNLTLRIKTARDMLVARRGAHWLELKAGDFVFFDSRLVHASAYGSRLSPDGRVDGALPLPPEHTKYVLYWDACATADYADDFMRHLVKRAAAAPDDRLYGTAVTLRYPNDYSPAFVENATRRGIRIASAADVSARR